MSDSKPGRTLQSTEAYSKLYLDSKIKPEIRKRLIGQPPPSRGQKMSLTRNVASYLFANEKDPDVLKKVAAEVERSRVMVQSKKVAMQTLDMPTDPTVTTRTPEEYAESVSHSSQRISGHLMFSSLQCHPQSTLRCTCYHQPALCLDWMVFYRHSWRPKPRFTER